MFYVSTFYFILWAAVSAAYSALLSSSYFERINDDDDDDDMLCWQANDHPDIFINQRIECYLNNTINLRPLTPHIMPCPTHKMAIVSWP